MIQVNRAGEWMAAEELKSELLDWKDQNHAPVLDLAGINYMEASCLQVIVAFQNGNPDKGQALTFENISPGLREWIKFAGATDFFGKQTTEVSN